MMYSAYKLIKQGDSSILESECVCVCMCMCVCVYCGTGPKSRTKVLEDSLKQLNSVSGYILQDNKYADLQEKYQ